jgi:primosomal protein N'
LERLNNRWRRHLLLKLSLDAALAEVQAAVESVSVRGVSVVIDVDPVSLS